MPIDSTCGILRREHARGRRAPRRTGGDVPAQVAVDAASRPFGEAVHVVRARRVAAVDDAGHDATTGRADVDGGEDAARVMALSAGTRRRRRRRRARAGRWCG